MANGQRVHPLLIAASEAIATLLTALVGQVEVSKPLKTRAIAEAKVRIDEVAARILAQLLAADFLPSVGGPTTGPHTAPAGFAAGPTGPAAYRHQQSGRCGPEPAMGYRCSRITPDSSERRMPDRSMLNSTGRKDLLKPVFDASAATQSGGGGGNPAEVA